MASIGQAAVASSCGGGATTGQVAGASGAPVASPLAPSAHLATGDAHAGHGELGSKSPGQHDTHAHGGGKSHEGHGDMVIVERDKPEDRERSRNVLRAVMDAFADVDASRLKANEPGGTHRRLTPEMRREFTRRHPDLPVPGSLVFTKDGSRPIGIVFNGKENPNLDLGMGTGHRHEAGGLLMQHVWFAPQDIDAAFTDQGRRGKDAAIAHQRRG